MENSHFECGGENEKRNTYFVCDFNRIWLKDSSFLCYIDVLLSVEDRVVLVIKSKMLPLINISKIEIKGADS